MNKQLLFFGIFILLFNNLFSQDTTRGFTIKNNKDSIGITYALITGISSYPNIKPLLYADDDAYLFAEYLTNEKICKKKNVFKLIDSAATTANFYAKLNWLLYVTQPYDRVFIYFAGHGDVEELIESGFLLTYNCVSTNYSATAIDLSMLERHVNAFVNKKVKIILITDACRSGNLTGGLGGASATMSSITNNFRNVIKILSCQPEQLSLEKDYPGGGHGVFTYHLVDGLSGMADTDGDSSITLREIGFYLDIVRAETQRKQIPKIDGDPEGEIGKFDGTNMTVRQAQTGRKEGKPDFAVISPKNTRGTEDSSWKDNYYYLSFNEHIRKLRFIDPQNNNAYFIISEAVKKREPEALVELMKLELSAVLEDEAQKWLNKYLRGELEYSTPVILSDLKKVSRYLETIGIMIGKNDFRYAEIEVKKVFFEAYYVWKSKNKNSYSTAVNNLENVNKLVPNQAWIYNLIGLLNSEMSKYAESKTAYENATRLAPSWVYPWNNLGFLYKDAGKLSEAHSAYQKAIQIDSSLAYPWNGLGTLYRIEKKYKKAESSFKKAIEINPDYASPWYNLGSLYQLLKRDKESKDAYEKARKINSKFHNIFVGTSK